MKYTKFLFILFSLIEFVYSFKLNNTFNHESGVTAVCDVKIYFATFSVNYLAVGLEDGTVKIWDIENSNLKYTFDQKC
jgi:hypothetical protein